MAANQTKWTIILADRFSRVAEQIRRKTQGMGSQFSQAADRAERFRKKLKSIGDAARSFADSTKYASAAIVGFGLYALKESARMETLMVSFDVLIGKTALAKKTFEELVDYAARTPFRLANIAQAGKVMLAANVPAEELTHRLGQLGDLAAASDRPLREFALIFSKIKGKNKVQGEELIQLSEKGVNVAREMSLMFTKKFADAGVDTQISEFDVFQAVEKGLISFEMFEEVLDRLTGPGGRFHNLTETLAYTLGGLWSTLADNTQLASAALGDVMVNVFNLKVHMQSLIKVLTPARVGIKEFADENVVFSKWIIVMLGVLPLATASMFALSGAVGVLRLSAFALSMTVIPFLATILGITWAVTMLVVANEKGILSMNFLISMYEPWAWILDGIIQKLTVIKNLLIAPFGFGPYGEWLMDKFGMDIPKKLEEVDLEASTTHDLSIALNVNGADVQDVKQTTSGNSSTLYTGLQYGTA